MTLDPEYVAWPIAFVIMCALVCSTVIACVVVSARAHRGCIQAPTGNQVGTQ